MRTRAIFSSLVAVGMAATWMACTVNESEGDATATSQGAGGAASGTSTGTSTGTGPATTGPASSSVQSSTVASSSSTGGGMVTNTCNPVTNAPCNTAAGEACDGGYQGGEFQGFQCYPAPNDQKICEACNGGDGPWCSGSMTCGAGDKCARYCCSDADCGTGTCTKGAWPSSPDLGLCEGGNGGGGGAGGGGGGGPMTGGPTCNVPAFDMAPSMGSCVMVSGG